MRKRNLVWTVLFSLLVVFLNANNSDSLSEQQLIREGRAQFCRLLDRNDEAIEQHHPERMQFVVMLSGEESVDRVLSETTPGHTPDPAGQGALKDSLNAKLQRIYSDYGVELYLLVISSLDVIVSSPLPNNVTVSQLFTQKLYDDRTNLQAMRAKHESITNGIISSTIKGRNRDCIVLSDCSYCGAFFPNSGKGCRKLATVFTNESSPSTYALDIRRLSSDFCLRLKSSNLFINGGENYSLPEAVKMFEESAKYFRTKSDLLHTYTPSEMSTLLDAFDYTLDFEELTYAEREHILSVYAGYNMDGSWMFNGEGEEGHVLQVLKYVRKEDVGDLLAILSGPSSLRNNENYYGDKDDDALIRKLIHRMDDAFMSRDDNYTAMVQVLTHHMMTNEQVFNEHLPTTDEGWLNRRIYWYDTYLMSEPPVGTHHYAVTLNDNGSVDVQKKVVDYQDVDYNNAAATAHYTSHWDENYPPQTFQPFDLVFFTNRSSVTMLQAAGAQHEQVFIAPAIFLKYASDKTFNASTLRAVAVSLDAIAIATGPGAIAGAMEAGSLALAAFEALQFTGAAANLVANQINDPELQSVVDKYNMIVGVWGFTHIIASTTKFTVEFFTQARAGNLKPISSALAEDFKQSYAAAGGKLEELDEATRGKLKKMEEYLGGAGAVVAGVSQRLQQFIDETGIVAKEIDDPTLLENAKTWQGKGSYPGVDNWFTVEIPAGTKVYGGLPGQTAFYAFEPAVQASGLDKVKYWESLQVEPHPKFGYRTQLGEYVTNKTLHAVISKVEANQQFGSGGAWQIFIKEFQTDVNLTSQINLH